MFQLYKKKLIHDANDFEWTKQARFYWRPQASMTFAGRERGDCDHEHDFAYSYGFRSKERLVVTPLTDKCCITLAQAGRLWRLLLVLPARAKQKQQRI